ncbi:MAG TPA: DUF4097 family beta strand repeat-containing protein [Trebonia sp.]
MFRSSRLVWAPGLVLAAGAVILALNGCGTGVLAPSGTGAARGLDASSATPRTYVITSRVTTVAINGGAGTIMVTGSSRSTIAVTEQAYYSVTRKPPTTSHVVSGTTLTLSYSCPAQLTCGVAYDVQVPRGVTVRVSDREGAITLASLAGPVQANTIAGVITATGLASPAVTLASTAGSVTAAFTAVPASVTASTNAGSITLTVPDSAAYQVHAHTYVGNSAVTVHQSATSKSVINASCDLGNVTISPS